MRLDPTDQQPIDPPTRLSAPTARLLETRVSLHRLAEQVLSPARERATGRIGLRATPGGFGTPPLEEGVQIRVEATELVVTDADGERRAPISSLAAAGELVAPGRLPDGRELDAEPLPVDPDSATLLSDWLALGAAVLAELTARAGASGEPSKIQLWPEHFDIAVELGVEAAGTRATYGFSPGDDEHPEPYVYVGPWVSQNGELWQATGFAGAEVGYAELLAADAPGAAALAFLEARRAAL